MSRTVLPNGTVRWSGRDKKVDGGIHCPSCRSADTMVYNSRPWDGDAIRRYRQCEGCHHRFTTMERVEQTAENLQTRLPA